MTIRVIECEVCKRKVKWWHFNSKEETIHYFGPVMGRYYDYYKTREYHKECFDKREKRG